MGGKPLDSLVHASLDKTCKLYDSVTNWSCQNEESKIYEQNEQCDLDFAKNHLGTINSYPQTCINHPNIFSNETLPSLEKTFHNTTESTLQVVQDRNDSLNQSTSPINSSNHTWHAPWNCYRVISGHLGWVRSIAFDHMNEWYCTGSSDRTIKVWDTASGELRLTLTGHVEQVTGLALSQRHPLMFSCGLDKMVKCWDLEYNKVIRSYHGHLSGVYCLAIHPMLDLIFSGGRDSVCRVWDMRTKAQVYCLTGHDNTLASILTQSEDPQVVTGSFDSTIRFWDLRNGNILQVLPYHKRGVRALAKHPEESIFYSASVDNMKKFGLPDGKFIQNMTQQHRCIINTLAINKEGVLVSGGDNGSIWFWDSKTGNCFQEQQSVVQPGSLDSESGIFAATFDKTGTRLVTCEADKTIKMWKEDENATQDIHESVHSLKNSI